MGVCHPMVIVEDKDGGHYAGCDHEHDGVEIGRYKENMHTSNIFSYMYTDSGIFALFAYLITISISINQFMTN